MPALRAAPALDAGRQADNRISANHLRLAACVRWPARWPSISIAPCDQVAAGHRRHRGERADMPADLDLDLDHREVSAHRTINMQASFPDTAQPLQIYPGRARASSPIVGHQKHQHVARRGAHGSRNRFADNVPHLLCDACCRKSVQCVMTGHENRIGQIGQM
mgnify:CR=1 FL=1